MFTLLVVIIIVAFVFDFINGFHDSANSIATIVSTKVLTPFQAVIWAAVFNFAAFFIFKDSDSISGLNLRVESDCYDATSEKAGGIGEVLGGFAGENGRHR